MFAFVFVALPLAIVALPRAFGPSAAPSTSASGLDLDALDRTAEPCGDFYQFACGEWVAKNPVPADRRSWGRFNELQERNFTTLRRILETPGATGDRRKASDYYAACTDERAIESSAMKALQPELARIAALTNIGELPGFLAHLQDIATLPGVPGRDDESPLFTFGSTQDFKNASQMIAAIGSGGYALPDRDQYLKTDERSRTLRTQYVDHIRQMFVALGRPADDVAREAGAVLTIETALAKATLDVVAKREPANLYHVMSVADLQKLTPHFDWQTYFTASRTPAFTTINVSEPEFVKAMDAIVFQTSMSDLKAYFRWTLLHDDIVMLPERFRQADFEFFSKTLRGQQAPLPRWRQCLSEVDERLGEALGKAFVEETFGPQAKADTLAMVQGIKAAMKRDIAEATWMSDATKAAANTKLAAVADRIGYPDKWRDYETVRVTKADALGDFKQAVTADRHRDVKKIGQPFDRGEWAMTPPTVNAYYSGTSNNINFPAGILQPPFYASGRDAAVNYGAAGSVIGHELSHGFDDKGRQFDGQGNLRDWWTPADGKAFDERAACIANQYSDYVVAGDAHINGKLTLGENVGDNGGVRLALMAYLAGPGATAAEPVDGFTPEQRFFLGYAQVWCENARPEAERLKAATNPHSSNKYRVNGVLSNMPEFQKAFSCKAGAPMVRANACRVW
ncbi:MAG TPA: M13 family metallopeptidase [Vicinamibacterales bacterium]